MIPDNSEDAGRRYCQLRLDAATASGPPHFDYQPLPPRHIRIIELQPGERSDPFRARFIVGSLDEPFEYDGLSYMWGDAAPVDRVVVDGAVIPIAWNLARALEYLRDHMNPEPLRIWIDAICINQQDDAERANQVGLMRLLYRKAECVRIWINAPDLDEESEALAALRKFQVRGEEPGSGLGDDPDFWDPILPILENKYWSRAWIQQEIINARFLILHCMNASVIGTTVFEFRRAVELHLTRSIGVPLDMLVYGKLLHSDWSPRAQEMFAFHGEARQRYKLIHLLHTKEGLLVSRGHDRFYAIMHLAQDYRDGDLAVDYSKSLEQVMLDIATHHISRHHDLEFLLNSFQPNEVYSDSCEGLARPSWIPNSWVGGDDLGTETANRGMIYSQCSHKSIDMSTMRLSVRGIKIDRLRKLFKFEDHSFSRMTVVRFWASALGQHLQPYMSDNAAGLPHDIYCTISSYRRLKDFDHESLKAALAYLYELNQVAELTNLNIFEGQEALLPGWSDSTHAILKQFLILVGIYDFTLTDKGSFGLTPRCNTREEDEVWMVLGCPQPIILRQRDDGAYSHVCAATFPILTDTLRKHDAFGKFTMETQPGEKIGQWTMEDIELA
ncbi:hypothetical protein HBI81_195150 [Parastagonospora nodorum]|nr:hypothetical protein HBH53_199860 [Parastagonospora nodorum]KAH4016387.1 hypothetical protein HBI09_202520 [Parastagonospora nodorum]KAH4050025.1 hypothetical protein HBH49_141080 [Parastagonospora nodorum]KAH4981585.1 hypothetical protein HBI77_220080 [Parastagonospora nodorum]KAH5068608.1 hypothetical protein HBH95_190440 [Parastagonospora nodorum]